jgi:branched-chain amino acid transport system ATP-binding protein
MSSGASIVFHVRDLSKRFGGLQALGDYRLDLEEGTILGLIGPNGAGKTTAFNLLSGVLPPTAGQIVLNGEDVTGAGPEAFALAGIGRTFQNSRLFRDLAVWENVAVGLHMREGPGWLATVFGLASARRGEAALRAAAQDLLALVGLADLADRRAGELAYGLQRKVEIARALATRPAVLLLDEPAAGMNPVETDALTRTLRDLGETVRTPRGAPLTMIVVEHDMRMVMSLCMRIQVLNRGVLLAEGSPAAIQADPAVLEAYLGPGERRERLHADA